MSGLSPWALTAMDEFENNEVIHSEHFQDLSLRISATKESIWVAVSNLSYTPVYFRACYVPGGVGKDLKLKKTADGISIHIKSIIGIFDLSIAFSFEKLIILKYKCTLIPSDELFIPYWPRDILTTNHAKQPVKSIGEVHVQQIGTRSGLLYFSLPERDLRILYFQNLTELSPYAEQTGTSLAEVVGGSLPEIGLSLPETKDKPLKAGIKYTISDACIGFKTGAILTSDQATDYLDMLSEIYLQVPKPATRYTHWPDILEKGLEDLIENPGCWSMVSGSKYLNAYVCDYDTPPEIMVQLAVLLPLVDYSEWSGKTLDVMKVIKEGLAPFYSEKLKTLVRWHPAAEDKLKGEEEQKMPMVMDSWYLHHPLLNLSRLALKGDKQAEKLFLNSLGYAIKVAHKFKYQWPVFYKMDTLEIIKAETKPGAGGEQDVAGLYTHVMLQAYELTNEKKYLKEAEIAAKKLATVGYNIMYQANNTAFGAGALLRLYKLTGNERYLNLSYRCLASIFQNIQLWDCNYGFGKYIPTFFALFPLSDAPYTAAYEEQEVFCAFHDYLLHAEGVEILPSVRLLCSEFIRYLVERAPYYYPPMLPEEMISDEVKTGEVDRKLWIALEDIHDGIEKSGAVGQEVYGAGNAFGILPRHFIKIDGEPFLVFTDCPIGRIRKSKNTVQFHLLGDTRIDYRLRIVPDNNSRNALKLNFEIKDSEAFKTPKDRRQDLEIFLKGNKMVHLNWKKS
ncbi:hypothetical protein [Pedobacter rhodius]|uniref:Alpha-L-rhamnosidase six-hairpin glycosidase domain-containing protein n=1 Tax=Pedobacter rhodius TaxID=3004098 RepID=A0ABT4KUF0_9SPHI|nr:hypothetical protein [Pedobacter sp. SJ11]MCZ4222547.1 hypothetical protein [Pedobacter sp. SJ11]